MKASGNPVIFFLMGTLYSMIYVPAMSQSSYAFELTFQEVEGLYGRAIGKIRNITQDPYGYMWFSGEEEKCIYRYDGNKLTLFRKDNLNTNSLGGVNVNDIYADDKGIIWIAFGGTGMDSFDPSSNTFKHYRHDEVDQRSIASDNVNCIFKDSRGRIWVGTDEGLDQLNEATGEFTHFRHDPDNPRAISHNFISTVYEDRQRTIWVATAGYPWIVPDTNEGGLNRLQEDGTFTRFKHDPNDENSLISNHVLTLFEDSRGVFWVGTDGNGLHTMDRKTGKFQRYLYDPAHPQKLSRPPLKSDDFCKAFDVITFIVEDHSGAIWIGSMCSGINRYDPKNGKVTRYENSNGYPENTTWNGFVSRDGVLWICSQQNKLYRINPVRKVFKRVKLGAGVARFQPDNNGMWIGGEKGLLLVDSAGAILKTILIKNENNSAVSLTEVHRDSENKLWLGAADGVYVFDTNTEQYQHLDVDFTMGAVLHIKQDQSNPDWKWAASLEGGLLKFSRTGRLLRRYTFDKNDSSSIASDHIIFVIDDKDCLWIGTVSGISRLNKKSDRFKNYPSLKSTYAFKDSHGVIWAGSENGLFQYDDKLDKFIGVGYHSVVTTDRTYGITEDDHKNLWVSTPSTIVRIDSSRKLISQFGTENGIEQSSISPGAVYKTKGGEVFFGNYDGYYIIDPDQFSEFEKPQQILFNDFIVNPNSGKFPVDLIQKPVGELAPISLHHDQNSFSISFFFPDYREPRGNHFEVRLLGYDDTWRDQGSQTTSNFVAVRPGSYTYQLRAYTSGGSVLEKSISIVVSPPWWKTPLAYGSYALIALGLLLAARRVIVREERLKADLRLEHLNFEKAKEVDRIKTSFFTNISHEFRTPLTLISGPVQELMEKYADDPRTQAKLKQIKRNSELLLRLINQLLDLARLEAGTLKLENSEGDIYTFVRSIARSFESFAQQKDISLFVEAPGIVHSITFDKNKVETIIINLVNNAIKFTPSGGSVRINALAEESKLRLSIKDTGIGIPKENQEKIFERFHQVSEAHKEVGTGVGLSLVRELVALMGGSIEVVSSEGEGSEFKVIIPIQNALADLTKSVEESQQFVSEPTSNGSEGKKYEDANVRNGAPTGSVSVPQILVIEDNVDVREFIIDCLGSEFSFIEAENGAVGLEKAKSETPDMIISDVMMPIMDGIRMTEKIKTDIRTSHIPLIMLTAKSTEDSKLLGLRTGADDYLTKPFNKNELLLKVRNAIVRQAKLREKLRVEVMSVAPQVEVLSQDERFLKNVREKILNRLSDEQLGVESLAEDVALSRSQLQRKLKALTGMSVSELIRKLRLQRAAQLIEQNWGPVTQVAYEVGIANLSYFAKIFKDEFGVLPSVYAGKVVRHS